MTPSALAIQIIDSNGSCTIKRTINEPLWFGRDPECSVELPSPNVSRRHVELKWTVAGLEVTDSSANGTVVNDTLLRRATRLLRDGHVSLGIGPYRLHISPDMQDAPGPADQLPFESVPLVPKGGESPLDVGLAPIESPVVPGNKPAAVPKVSNNELGVAVRRLVRRQLLQHLDLPSLNRDKIKSDEMRPEVLAALRRIVVELIPGNNHEELVQELADEALGLGPLERFLADPDVNEIMVVDPETIFIERCGKVELSASKFTDDDSVRAVIERIVTPLGSTDR